MTMPEFKHYSPIARLSREVVITEKIDGTNAQIYVGEDGTVVAGSRNRWITPQDDNFGFAAWVQEHEDELRTLGPGRYFGEWWGQGIQRGYGIDHRRFSLFDVFLDPERPFSLPSVISFTPIITRGIFTSSLIDEALEVLRQNGSYAARGFMDPEGIVIYHVDAKVRFKKTFKNDFTGKRGGHDGK